MLVTDRRLMKPSFESALQNALSGGARLIQLREKDLNGRELLLLAQQAQGLCEQFGATLLINTRADIARASDAKGVHLPEHEMPPRDAKSCLPQGAICSVSVRDEMAARRAQEEGADALVFGTVFPTSSHMSTHVAGLSGLKQVASAVTIPVFAIGGIDARNAEGCLEHGAHGVAVRSAVWDADDVEAAVRALRRCGV